MTAPVFDPRSRAALRRAVERSCALQGVSVAGAARPGVVISAPAGAAPPRGVDGSSSSNGGVGAEISAVGASVRGTTAPDLGGGERGLPAVAPTAESSRSTA